MWEGRGNHQPLLNLTYIGRSEERQQIKTETKFTFFMILHC